MAKSRKKFSNQDSSLSPTTARTRGWDGPSRWEDYFGTDSASPLSSTSSRNFVHDGQSQGTTLSQSHKGHMHWFVHVFPNNFPAKAEERAQNWEVKFEYFHRRMLALESASCGAPSRSSHPDYNEDLDNKSVEE